MPLPLRKPLIFRHFECSKSPPPPISELNLIFKNLSSLMLGRIFVDDRVASSMISFILCWWNVF